MSTLTITHASKEPITSVKSYDWYSNVVKGCLFFAGENNTYNLAGECNYQYNLEVDTDKILDMHKLNYRYDYSDNEIIQSVFDDIRLELDLDISDEDLADLFDQSQEIQDFETNDQDNEDWILQQYQGILAHKLGYDCAAAYDEQGVVFIAYCVDRELTEIVL